jgi:hypothetical protein
LRGLDFTWLDAGELGMWSVPSPGFDPWEDVETLQLVPKAETTKLSIEPLSATSLSAQIVDAVVDACGTKAPGARDGQDVAADRLGGTSPR